MTKAELDEAIGIAERSVEGCTHKFTWNGDGTPLRPTPTYILAKALLALNKEIEDAPWMKYLGYGEWQPMNTETELDIHTYISIAKLVRIGEIK